MTPRDPVWQAIVRETLVEYLAARTDDVGYTMIPILDRPIELLPDELRPHARRIGKITAVPVRALALYATGAPLPADPEDL
jgi:hypothetical protein